MDTGTTKRRRGRRRLLILFGAIALTLAAASVIIAWTDQAAGARAGASTTETTADVHGTEGAGETSSTSTLVNAGTQPDQQEAGPATTTTAQTQTPPESSPTTIPATAQSTAQATSQAQAAKSAPARVKVYFLQGEKLTPVVKEVTGTAMVGTAALKLLFKGPSSADDGSGLTSAIPRGTALRSLSVKNGLATVDLSSDFVSGGGSSSMYLRLGQLIYTLTQFPTVDRVKIRIDGVDVRTLGGEGLLIGDSMTRAQYDGLIGGSSGAGAGSSKPGSSSFTVYFVIQEKLASQTRTVSFTPAVGRAALTDLLAGPSAAEQARGASTAIPANVKVNSLSIKDKVATVDLSTQFVSGGGTQSMYLRVGQIVYTLTQFPTVDEVRFLVDGKVLTTLGGEGLLLEQPLSRTDWAKLIQ